MYEIYADPPKDGRRWPYKADYFPRKVGYKADADARAEVACEKGGRNVFVKNLKTGNIEYFSLPLFDETITGRIVGDNMEEIPMPEFRSSVVDQINALILQSRTDVKELLPNLIKEAENVLERFKKVIEWSEVDTLVPHDKEMVKVIEDHLKATLHALRTLNRERFSG